MQDQAWAEGQTARGPRDDPEASDEHGNKKFRNEKEKFGRQTGAEKVWKEEENEKGSKKDLKKWLVRGIPKWRHAIFKNFRPSFPPTH